MKYKAKYIYKVTNVLNGRCYIGQTIDVNRRIKEHCKEWKDSTRIRQRPRLLSKAIQKYGFENFEVEVLEYCEDYNEKEDYYINKYNARYNEDDPKSGYNIINGGATALGEASIMCSHSKEEVEQIKDLLRFTNFSTSEIADMYGYDNNGTIVRISNGTIWYDKTLSYPLRNFDNSDIVDKVIELLKNSTMTQKEIAQKLGFKRSFVTMINIGQNHRREGEEYPIRVGRTR